MPAQLIVRAGSSDQALMRRVFGIDGSQGVPYRPDRIVTDAHVVAGTDLARTARRAGIPFLVDPLTHYPRTTSTLSPTGGYGAWAAGERTGSYRLGGEVALLDADGGSTISGADFALAIVDEIEAANHHREQVGVAY